MAGVLSRLVLHSSQPTPTHLLQQHSQHLLTNPVLLLRPLQFTYYLSA